MFHTYQPSGKISPVFYPMLILTMLIVAPSVSFLYVYFIWYIPSTLADIIAYAVEGDITHYVTLVNKHREGEPDKI